MRSPSWRLGRSFTMLVAASPLLSCSLMGLDDFGGAPCQSDDDCQAAKAQLEKGSSPCGDAVCRMDTGFCTWQERQETCNGIDDDCDGLIDEDLVLPTKKSNALLPASSAAVDYSFAPAPARTFVAVVAGGSGEEFTLDPGAPINELQYAWASDSMLQGSTNQLSCPTDDGTVPCDIAEVALAADARHLVVAGINTKGCAFGQLRVGLSDIEDAPYKVWLGKARDEQSEQPSNIASGVDVDRSDAVDPEVGGQRCTGASRKTSLRGATLPAVASLNTDAGGAGALLVWLAAHARSTQAPSDPIPVEALGLVVPADEPVWLDGAGGGIPQELGYSTSLSAPAVLALAPFGVEKYLVAFPAQRDTEFGVQLRTVQVEPARLLLGTPKFVNVGAADQVSLALGNEDRREVGLAWRSGSGADAYLYFGLLSLSDISTPEEILTPKNIRSMSTPEPRFAPQIIYQNTGFAIPEPSGGWYLSWVEAPSDDTQTLQVVRLRDESLPVLNHAALHSGVIAQPVLYPHADGDTSRVGYALIQPGTAPETFADWCK